MRLLSFVIFFMFFVSFAFSQSGLKYNTHDIAALKELPVKWERCWNMHNMDLMGNLLCDDVDFINVAGVWLKGKAAAVKDHKEKHEGIKFKTSSWKTDSVSIKYINHDLAILHIGWGISNDFENDGTTRQPRHGIFTWIVKKQHTNWLILAVQNTNIKL